MVTVTATSLPHRLRQFGDTRPTRAPPAPRLPPEVAVTTERAHASTREHAATAITSRLLLVTGLVLVATNLRPAVASVGPVLDDVRRGLGLSGTAVAVLTTVPVLCFGLLAPAGPRMARRLGMERTLGAVLLAVACGLLLRLGPSTATLFAGTVLAAGGIAVGNVVVPALVKRDFAEHTGPMMGIYSTALVGSAAFAAGATVPIEHALGQGWRGGLGVWALLAVVALLAWSPQLRGHTEPPEPPPAGALRAMLRDRLAWQVTAFMGLQSLSFYAVLAWLPSIFSDHGYDATTAGLLLSVSALVQAPVALVLPTLAARRPSQEMYAALAVALTGVGLLGVLVSPGTGGWVWAIFLGVGQGASFPLALTLVVLRTRRTEDTARLSAMAQSVGYVIAAAGPLLVGALHEAAGGWTWPLVTLLVLLVPQLITGVLAGRRLYVGG